MDKEQGIEHLHASGMPKRQIARTLGIDRKSVDRHLAGQSPKGASTHKAPTGEALTGQDDSKGAKAPTGSESEMSALCTGSQTDAATAGSCSRCVGFHELIVAKIEAGLTAQRIYQDLVADHGFTSQYHSVRRYVARLTGRKELPVRRMEVEPGQEMQIDYGQGARCKDHTGKYRKTYLFRMVLSHSRKGYTEAVTRLTTQSLIRSLENAFRAIGGVPKIVVFDNALIALAPAIDERLPWMVQKTDTQSSAKQFAEASATYDKIFDLAASLREDKSLYKLAAKAKKKAGLQQMTACIIRWLRLAFRSFVLSQSQSIAEWHPA